MVLCDKTKSMIGFCAANLVYLLLVSLHGVAGQETFILTGPNEGFMAGTEYTLTCTVDGGDVTTTGNAECSVPVPTIQLERIEISPASTVSIASSAFPGCSQAWTNKGRCVSGSGGNGVYVYEFKYTALQEHINDMNQYLRCSAGCAVPPGSSYPFTSLAIRPILPAPENVTTPVPPTTTPPEDCGFLDSKEYCHIIGDILLIVLIALGFVVGLIAALILDCRGCLDPFHNNVKIKIVLLVIFLPPVGLGALTAVFILYKISKKNEKENSTRGSVPPDTTDPPIDY